MDGNYKIYWLRLTFFIAMLSGNLLPKAVCIKRDRMHQKEKTVCRVEGKRVFYSQNLTMKSYYFKTKLLVVDDYDDTQNGN